ncbi:MAG: hypothetical protein JWQ36_1673 [Enterovirga sp.]|jgi:hypothetical protein|nr:hypothetical protein [Enterovirga sp.]
MIRSADFSEEAEIDLLPVAIVRRPLESVIGDRAKIRRAYDDLDWFDGADVLFEGRTRFALRHYDGHPPDTFTIYVDRAAEKDPGAVALLLRELDLSPDLLAWQNEGFARSERRRQTGAGFGVFR